MRMTPQSTSVLCAAVLALMSAGTSQANDENDRTETPAGTQQRDTFKACKWRCDDAHGQKVFSACVEVCKSSER